MWVPNIFLHEFLYKILFTNGILSLFKRNEVMQEGSLTSFAL